MTRALVYVSLGLLFGCQQLQQGDEADAGASSSSGGTSANADAGSVGGGGCGLEQSSGVQLCSATSQCPNVVVDTQAMPHCGFRIRGTIVDLVCACGTAICPMGAFTTCAEASQLLSSQTEQGVCVQLAEGRCVGGETTGAAGGGSGANPACDQQCVKDCGGGAACASVCNCD